LRLGCETGRSAMPAVAPDAQTTAASIGARTLDASWACAGVAGRSAVRARKSRPVRSAAPTVSPTPLVRAGALGAATADGEPWHALSASHDVMAACADPPCGQSVRDRRRPRGGAADHRWDTVQRRGHSFARSDRASRRAEEGVLEYSRRAGPAGGRRRNERRTRACACATA
jgi:hypothetical protein